MKKKGFVLLETVVVIVIVVIAMLGLFRTYLYLFGNLKLNRYYDNINDIYKVGLMYEQLLNGRFPQTGAKGYEIINEENLL